MESQNPALGRFCTYSSQVLSQPTLHQKESNQQKEFLKGCLFLWSESHPFLRPLPQLHPDTNCPSPNAKQ